MTNGRARATGVENASHPGPTTVRAWSIAVAVGLAVGVLTWVLVGLLPDGASSERLPPPGDRVRAAAAALEEDPFYVAPELADRLSVAQREAVSDALADPEAPTYLIYWTSTNDAGYYLDSSALDQVMALVGDGRYAVVDDTLSATTASRGTGDDYIDASLLVARPDQALLAYAGAMAAAPEEAETTPSDYWGGPGGGIAAGALLASGAYLALLLLVGLASLARPRRGA